VRLGVRPPKNKTRTGTAKLVVIIVVPFYPDFKLAKHDLGDSKFLDFDFLGYLFGTSPVLIQAIPSPSPDIQYLFVGRRCDEDDADADDSFLPSGARSAAYYFRAKLSWATTIAKSYATAIRGSRSPTDVFR